MVRGRVISVFVPEKNVAFVATLQAPERVALVSTRSAPGGLIRVCGFPLTDNQAVILVTE